MFETTSPVEGEFVAMSRMAEEWIVGSFRGTRPPHRSKVELIEVATRVATQPARDAFAIRAG